MIWRWHTVADWIHGRNFTLGAEIGVKEGRFIRHLLSVEPQLTMYAIDPWEDQPGKNEDYIGWDWGNIYDAYRQRIDEFKDRALELHMYSDQAVHHVKDNSLDFVFIDAQHDFFSVMKDIDLWRPKVKRGGLISGHDYCDKFPGVVAAVREQFKGEGIITGANDCWGVWLP